ncbi:MAG: hypothetical protein HRU08_14155 [Oleispira sp.]|jgi:hypothetical protein|nr:hypothetical protein [Oleispira sp.]
MKYLILFLLFSAGISHAKIVSRNLTLSHHNIQVVDNYSAEKNIGLIRVKRCYNCKKMELILDNNTRFTVANKITNLENLLHIRLSQPSKAVRIQYNDIDKTVSFIHWNYINPEEVVLK